MQDRFVWYHALEDLQRLLPLPSPINIGQMSVFEMRRLCVRVAQTYKRWLGRSFTPRLVCATKCGRTRATQLLPGGKHLLTVTENGSLLLHWLHHRGAPVLGYLQVQSGDVCTAGAGFDNHVKIQLQAIDTSANTAFVIYSIHNNAGYAEILAMIRQLIRNQGVSFDLLLRRREHGSRNADRVNKLLGSGLSRRREHVASHGVEPRQHRVL